MEHHPIPGLHWARSIPSAPALHAQRCLHSSPTRTSDPGVEAADKARDDDDSPALRCACCLLVVASPRDVFSVDRTGPVGAYVNPFGYLHKVLTVLDAQQMVVIGVPSTLNTWFAGYAWQMAFCSACESHLGWRFSAAELDRTPPRFWGLSRAAIVES